MWMKLDNLLKYSKVMSKNKVFWVYLLGLWSVNTVSTLKITSLDVPKTAWDAVKLNCKYDVENGTLYAVKWYKDNTEFLRCTANGTIQQFPLKDISIYHTERSHTGSCFFELTALTSKSGGEYTCEVSLDWPTFQIAAKTAYLQVIEPSRIVQSEQTTEEVVLLSGSVLKSQGTLNNIHTVANILIVPFIICMF